MGVPHVTDRTNEDRRVRHRGAIQSLAFAMMAVAMLFAATAQAQTWYLMAPDEKLLSDPGVAIRMGHGPVVGPLEFMSRGQFSSRPECEPARQKLVTQWRQLAVIKRGSWDKYGFQSPSVFVRCIPSNDPQLKKPQAGAEAPPTLETFINRPAHRR
jgi:hypothetical protein